MTRSIALVAKLLGFFIVGIPITPLVSGALYDVIIKNQDISLADSISLIPCLANISICTKADNECCETSLEIPVGSGTQDIHVDLNDCAQVNMVKKSASPRHLD